MRVSLLLFFAVVAVVSARRVDYTSLDLSFEDWSIVHGKVWENDAHELLAKATFESNRKLVKEMQKEMEADGVKLALTKFADMSPEEFSRKILLPSRTPPPFHPSKELKVDVSGPAPDNFDWRSKGAVTPVADQGTVGSCWAFSTVENIESAWFLANHTLAVLSKEQVVECDATEDLKNNHADCGVFGGWPYLAMEYVIKAGGLMAESDYPYCVGSGACYPCMAPGYNASLCGPPVEYCNKTEWSCKAPVDEENNANKFVASISDWQFVNPDESTMNIALYKTGPFSVLLDATGLQFYHSGVWRGRFCSKTNLDHAVLMVGYGVDKGLLGETNYWLIKNSWGEGWGEKGYFRILRGSETCGINTAAVTAVV